jgi:hypothetical protein
MLLKGGDVMGMFKQGSVPVAVVAKIYGKDPAWVRAGIITGWLPIGKATRKGKLVRSVDEISSKLGRINYYISPKLLFDETGYIWKGEDYGNDSYSRTIKKESVQD